MSAVSSFLDSPEDTREEIMRATYFALSEHGYADLTIQRIGAVFPKSKSLIYHHYDGKDELLLEFLAFVLDRFEENVPDGEVDDAEARLWALLDHLLATPLPDGRRAFTGAMVDLRAQATHDERYREQFTRHDRFFRERIAAVVAAGIDDGTFADVDVDAVATFLAAAVVGTMTQRVTSEVEIAPAVRDRLEEYVQTALLADQ
ncbi:TetR family transcriptional regulator C-terminal domain-containing protein [Halobellus sp. GM3]|uniref:TetR family transcriptional regulator C-terminal domain-containing protein n=1 Tax=Halobellus sp. GM3 TaxID=3458410 RepID=UPI00403DB570